MSVFINPKEDEYADSIKNNYVGFRALVHSPYDFAEVDAKGLSIGINEEKFIAIRAYTSFSTGYIKILFNQIYMYNGSFKIAISFYKFLQML